MLNDMHFGVLFISGSALMRMPFFNVLVFVSNVNCVCLVPSDKVEMRGFTLVLHGTEVAPGEPSPNNKYQKFPPTITSVGNHISHQDLTHSTTGVREDGGGVKDTNTQRHNPHDDAGHHSGRAGGDGDHDASVGYHGKASMGPDDVGHSAASRPAPVSLNTMMAQNPSVKKAGVDDHTIEEGGAKGTRDHPVPVKISAPDAGPLPAGCLYADPDSSACIGLCLLVLGIHCFLGGLVSNGFDWWSCVKKEGREEVESIKARQNCGLQTPSARGEKEETVSLSVQVVAKNRWPDTGNTANLLENNKISGMENFSESVCDGAVDSDNVNELVCKWRKSLYIGGSCHRNELTCSNKEEIFEAPPSPKGATFPVASCLPVSARSKCSLHLGEKDKVSCYRNESSRSAIILPEASSPLSPSFDTVMAATQSCRQRLSS